LDSSGQKFDICGNVKFKDSYNTVSQTHDFTIRDVSLTNDGGNKNGIVAEVNTIDYVMMAL